MKQIKLIGTLVVAIAATMGVVVPAIAAPPSPRAAAIRTVAPAMPRSDIRTIKRITAGRTDDHVGLEDWKIGVVYHWRWSWHERYAAGRFSDHAWARPINAKVYVDAPGSWEPCGPLDGKNGVEVRVFIHGPANGRNWASRPALVPCHINTRSRATIDMRGAPRFPYTGGLAPRVRLNYQIKLDLMKDQYGAILRRFKRHNR
jgi:hypothetical protein